LPPTRPERDELRDEQGRRRGRASERPGRFEQPLRFDLATGARLDEGRREKDALQPDRRREGGCVHRALLVHLERRPALLEVLLERLRRFADRFVGDGELRLEPGSGPGLGKGLGGLRRRCPRSSLERDPELAAPLDEDFCRGVSLDRMVADRSGGERENSEQAGSGNHCGLRAGVGVGGGGGALRKVKGSKKPALGSARVPSKRISIPPESER